MGADIRQQDQNEDLDDIHDELNGLAGFAVDQVYHDIHAQVRMLAVRIGAAHKDGPDEEAGHHFVRPLDGVVQKVAENDIGIDQNNAEGQGYAADERVKVCQDPLNQAFLFHRQSLHRYGVSEKRGAIYPTWTARQIGQSSRKGQTVFAYFEKEPIRRPSQHGKR